MFSSETASTSARAVGVSDLDSGKATFSEKAGALETEVADDKGDPGTGVSKGVECAGVVASVADDDGAFADSGEPSDISANAWRRLLTSGVNC